MLFDMDTLKRLGSRSSPNCTAIPQVFVTMSPETETTKRTKPSSKQRRIKIAIMGKSGVGKSALVVRYITKRYIGEYSRDESRVETQMEIEDENILVEMFDTSRLNGDEGERKLLEHINWADGFILVFSITDYWSLYEVARLTSVIKQIKDEEEVPIIVFSNQIDMEKQRRISRNEARQFLNDLGKPVFQTSAACNYDSVRKAFEEASHLVYKWKFPAGKARGRSGSIPRRSRSGSIMDPLREVFNRLHSSSEEDVKKRRRASSSDLDLRHHELTQIDEIKATGNLNSALLTIPRSGMNRNRSQSFA